MGIRQNRSTREWEDWNPLDINPQRGVFCHFKRHHWVAFARCFTIYLSLCLFIVPAWALSSEELDALVPIIIQAESSGDPGASGDRGNSRGLMQISKQTWKMMTDADWDEAFNPDKNVQVGRHLLEVINESYRRHGIDASISMVILSYNTGKYYLKGDLPKWRLRHPNNTYRVLFVEDLKKGLHRGIKVESGRSE